MSSNGVEKGGTGGGDGAPGIKVKSRKRIDLLLHH